MSAIKVARPGFLDRLRRALRSRRYVIEDRSMEPVLWPGDRVLLDPRAFAGRPPSPGQIVAVGDPESAGRWLVKRVAAVGPGSIAIPTPGLTDRGEWPEVPVPDGAIYVLSEALDGRDSRRFGPVPLAAIEGLVWYRTGPSGRRGPI